MSASEMLRRWVEAVNHHDAAAFTACYAPNAVVRDPQYPDPLAGTEAIRKDIEDYFRAFPDLRQELRSTVEAGEVIAFEITWRGTHLGPLTTDSGHVPPTAKRIEVDGAGFNRMDEEGRIVEQNRYYDMAKILAQLELA
jgi:steroid delta-isomerase-like uncharacterized protein